MTWNSCPMPDPLGNESGAVRRMLAAKRIAVVGLSTDRGKPSYAIATYLREAGKEVIPINPNHELWEGLRCYRSLREVPGAIDVVNVFRRAEHCAEVVREAIEVEAQGVWLQSGIVSDEAMNLAAEAGMLFVQDRCIMVEHMRAGGSGAMI